MALLYGRAVLGLAPVWDPVASEETGQKAGNFLVRWAVWKWECGEALLCFGGIKNGLLKKGTSKLRPK